MQTSHLINITIFILLFYFSAKVDFRMSIFRASKRLSMILKSILQVVHHLLSVSAVAYSMLTGEGQLYTFMVLISEATTPGINLRW